MSELPAIQVEDQILTTRDQTQLYATLYHPQEPNQRSVLIASAMGIKQSFYRHYAAYLAQCGFVVLTFDYRGIGQSLKRGLWGYEAHLGHWGGQDVQAALHWLKHHYPTYPLTVVGHSVGAMLLGMAEHNTRVDALFSVTTPNMYWGNWPRLQRPLILAFWYGLLPWSTAAAGYFPAQAFHLGEQLPKGVALDWARAGRNPRALRGVYEATSYNHFDDFTGALLCYSFADDNLAPKAAVENFLSLFTNARSKHHEHIQPADIGQTHIGHYGFFREAQRETLWAQSAAWLLNPQSQAAGQPAQAAAGTMQLV